MMSTGNNVQIQRKLSINHLPFQKYKSSFSLVYHDSAPRKFTTIVINLCQRLKTVCRVTYHILHSPMYRPHDFVSALPHDYLHRKPVPLDC